jgi:polyferredoxin
MISEIETVKLRNSRNRLVRLMVLVGILALSTVLGQLHQINKAFPPLDAFCPFGGLESMYVLLRFGGMLKRIAWSTFILFFITLGTSFVFRRAFCGEICALGTLQELFGKLGRLIFKKRFLVPEKTDRALRYVKYGILGFFLLFTFLLGFLVIRPFDPWAAYHHILSNEVFEKFLIGFIVLMASLVGSLFFDRFFCKYLCPMGGFLALTGKAGRFKIRRNTDSCIDCNACGKQCPMNIKVQELTAVSDAECIHCSECVNVCPVPETLYIADGKNRRVKPLTFLLIILIAYSSVIGITSFTGDFVWKKPTLNQESMMELIQGPDHIMENHTVLEVLYAYRVPPQMFLDRFGIKEKEVRKTLKSAGIDVGEARDYITELLLFSKQ